MSVAVKWGVILAVAIAVVSVLFTVAGLHKNPIAGMVFIPVAIVLNVVAVFLALRQTAGANSYGRQLLAGAVLGVVASVLIFLTSYLMLSVLFPNYMDEMREGTIAFMERMQVPDVQIDAAEAKFAETTAAGQAMQGMIGTFVTSLVASAVVAIFKRKK